MQAVPSIGRIVHFVDSGVHYAAIVTKVWSATCVNLYVFGNGDLSYVTSSVVTSVEFDAEGSHGRTWHWPEREA